jgi:hypothetical protein
LRARQIGALGRRWIGILLFGLVGLVYVGLTLSPSSYALVFATMGVEGEGPWFGKARPIRSDEWGVVTPLIQATVNNGLKRFNTTSFYQEDLRMTYALPVADWGMGFKPTQWPYLLVNPAYAFSWHHFWISALFLWGYARLFGRLHVPAAQGILFSGLLYASAFSQHWWTTLGPNLAYFPWVLLAALTPGPSLVRFGLFYWLSTCWFLSLFYPPIFISLGFVGGIVYLAYRPVSDRWHSLVSLALGGLAAAGTACFYLQDYLRATAATVYPGQRRVGGGGVSWQLWSSLFFPDRFIHHAGSLLPANVCEVSMGGSWYLLGALVFLDYRRLQRLRDRPTLLLAGGLALVTAWMHLPVPAWLGSPLLWQFVPPSRMAFAEGLLWLLLLSRAAVRCGLVLRPARLGLLLLAIGASLVPGMIGVRMPSGTKWAAHLSLAVGAYLLVALRPRLSLAQSSAGLALVCLVPGCIGFAGFNPLQPAWPIFNRPSTPVSRALTELATRHGGVLQVSGFFGATLNGWGYRSVGHTLAVPQMAAVRQMFPQLGEEDLQRTFNRYARLEPASEVRLPGLAAPDAVLIPGESLCAQRMPRSLYLGEPRASQAQRPGGPARERELAERPPTDVVIDALRRTPTGWDVEGRSLGAGLGQPQAFTLGLRGPALAEGWTASIESVQHADWASQQGDDALLCSAFVAHLKQRPPPPPGPLRLAAPPCLEFLAPDLLPTSP